MFSQLLEQHGIRPTANRITVVGALQSMTHPVSMKELEDRLLTLDKSSIFRVLTLLREHHLVHVIETGDGSVRYELCHSDSQSHDDDEHVHFYCEQCHRTLCLHDTPVPQVNVPDGYAPFATNVLVRGLCPRCRSRQRREAL